LLKNYCFLKYSLKYKDVEQGNILEETQKINYEIRNTKRYFYQKINKIDILLSEHYLCCEIDKDQLHSELNILLFLFKNLSSKIFSLIS
jgi:hypothetical protein